MRDLLIENEKLKVIVKTAGLNSLEGLELPDLKTISKEKLVYELGGKDGAHYALKFIDNQAAMKEELNRIATEMQKLKMSNITLSILADDKNQKLHKINEDYKVMKNQMREKEE